MGNDFAGCSQNAGTHGGTNAYGNTETNAKYTEQVAPCPDWGGDTHGVDCYLACDSTPALRQLCINP